MKDKYKEQKNVLSKVAVSLIALVSTVVYMFLAYEILWLNVYPSIVKGYIPYAIVLIIIFIILSVTFGYMIKVFLGSNKLSKIAKNVKEGCDK